MELRSDASKQYIAEALLQLMKTKPYPSITNKNITDRAGFSHITIYRHFKNKEDILSYYVNYCFAKWKQEWDDHQNIAFNLFSFFQKHKFLITALYQANQQYLLISHILSCCDYKEDDIAVLAYAKAAVAYFIFGWCDVWYQRGMKETPQEMAALMEQQQMQAS